MAAFLMIAGSMIFGIGAAIGVPRVFMTQDPADRLRLLEDRRTAWRAAGPLYAAGPLIAAVGVGVLAAAGGPGRVLYALASVLLTVGALAWARSAVQRVRRVRAFAYGELPGWPFAAYVWLTIAGLALLGAGLLRDDVPAWLGWLTLAADAAFLVGYLRAKDIPPFFFYLLFILIGVVLL
ncbi:MAG: hypothetical protein HOV79_05390 [Hamadaea sp.]|nr:hypothetical protein [Hamadaea sp.]